MLADCWKPKSEFMNDAKNIGTAFEWPNFVGGSTLNPGHFLTIDQSFAFLHALIISNLRIRFQKWGHKLNF